MGKVIGYNIYSQRFSGNYRFSPTQKVPFMYGIASKAQVELPKGDQKVWITALTSKGEGPKSNEWTVFADDLHHGMFLENYSYIYIIDVSKRHISCFVLIFMLKIMICINSKVTYTSEH